MCSGWKSTPSSVSSQSSTIPWCAEGILHGLDVVGGEARRVLCSGDRGVADVDELVQLAEVLGQGLVDQLVRHGGAELVPDLHQEPLTIVEFRCTPPLSSGVEMKSLGGPQLVQVPVEALDPRPVGAQLVAEQTVERESSAAMSSTVFCAALPR